VVADRAWDQVVLFQDPSGAAARIQLADNADGISDPVGLLLSPDGATAYVANAGAGTVSILSLTGGAAHALPCECQPRGMQALHSDSVFALTERADEPIVLLDAVNAEPRIVVVPPAKVREPLLLVLP
jgi:hypothetical protein